MRLTCQGRSRRVISLASAVLIETIFPDFVAEPAAAALCRGAAGATACSSFCRDAAGAVSAAEIACRPAAGVPVHDNTADSAVSQL